MRRRKFARALAAIAASAVLPAGAQRSGRIYRVGAHFGGGAASMHQFRTALVERLAARGFVEGRNVRVDVSASGAVGLMDDLDAIRELLAKKPDALLVCLTRGTQAAQRATRTVPIVFAWVADPLAAGLVKSFAHPGANITGVTNRFGELLVKRLDLATELVPDATRIAIAGTNNALYPLLRAPVHDAAARAGIELLELALGGSWEGVIAAAARARAAAVIPFNVFAATGTRVSGEAVVKDALAHRMPVVFAGAEMVEAGGLISYGTNLVEDVRRATDLVARILKGAKPGGLAVDQAARFELVVNRATAKALGISIPASIMLRADRVIE